MAHVSEVTANLANGGITNSRPIRLFCQVACTVGSGVILLSFVAGVQFFGLLMAAALCGIAESRGRCGMSHIGMIAPLRTVHPRLWLRCCLAYSLCGLSTAYLMGLALAGLGSLFNLWSSLYFLGFTGLACIALLLRELGVFSFAAPQCDRQTVKSWAHTFGMVTGTGMWGAHIGLGITTVITYGGLYCILLVAFGLGVGRGEWMLVAFWLGRITLLWMTPTLLKGTTDGIAISDTLEHSANMFRMTALYGMVSIFCVLITVFYSLIT